MNITRDKVLNYLLEENDLKLKGLWRRADEVRRANVGDAVHLRGLIEFSNYCVRLCGYCGLRADNKEVVRYRLTKEEILECAVKAVGFGYGTVVMQSGEDFGIDIQWVCDVVRMVKQETGLAVTLSLGERSHEDLAAWREAGADRYLLRFETSNRALFDSIHPPLSAGRSDRMGQLRDLRDLGYEVGSGVMVGIPGQTFGDLADDVMAFQELDLDMIGVGPFIAHPSTPLGNVKPDVSGPAPGENDQAPATEEMTYKMVALARLACPLANIPSTTALATLNLKHGREKGLERGANVVMPNLTPPEYRALYEIYPAKACIRETADDCHGCMKGRIFSIGREVGSGPGHSPNRLAREDATASDGSEASRP